MADVIGAFFRVKRFKMWPTKVPEGVDGSFSGLDVPQQLFEFGGGQILNRFQAQADGPAEPAGQSGVGE